MFKFTVILSALLLQSCSGYLSKQEGDDAGYFSDASDCLRSSARKESIKVPTGRSMTVVDVPIGSDAGFFGQCMEQAGHSAAQVEADEYLKISHACMKEASGSATPDATYAKCVRRGNITVETISPGK
ncbi:MAG: hypothetical protein CTY16_07815 [Methylobacter sp.]|nr:MAG: hypothetical protein CTY16_07815 [Methylobacter sp.]